MMQKAAFWLMLLMMLSAGCVNTTPTAVVGTEAQAITSEPKPTQTMAPPIQERVVVIPGVGDGLTIMEYPMLIKESVEEVLEEFSGAEWNLATSWPYEAKVGEDLISYRINEILAEENAEGIALSQNEVIIFKNDEPMMTIPLGTAGPISPAYGIYSDGTTWYLEVDRGESFVNEDGGIEIPNLGDIYLDGESLNEAKGYDASFGFTFLDGQPFYLFERDGKFGYSFDGVEYPLPFTFIWYHRCCSAGFANPRSSDTSVAIFGNKGDQRYLVVIGNFE